VLRIVQQSFFIDNRIRLRSPKPVYYLAYALGIARIVAIQNIVIKPCFKESLHLQPQLYLTVEAPHLNLSLGIHIFKESLGLPSPNQENLRCGDVR